MKTRQLYSSALSLFALARTETKVKKESRPVENTRMVEVSSNAKLRMLPGETV